MILTNLISHDIIKKLMKHWRIVREAEGARLEIV